MTNKVEISFRDELKEDYPVEQTLAEIGSIRNVARKRSQWAYMKTDDSLEKVVETFGRPPGTPAREGTDDMGARLVAVWMKEHEPDTEPEFVASGPAWTMRPPPGWPTEKPSLSARAKKILARLFFRDAPR